MQGRVFVFILLENQNNNQAIIKRFQAIYYYEPEQHPIKTHNRTKRFKIFDDILNHGSYVLFFQRFGACNKFLLSWTAPLRAFIESFRAEKRSHKYLVCS